MSLLKIEMMIHGKCCYSGHWFCIHGMLGWHTTWPIVLYRILLRKRVCIILLELLSQEIKFCALIQLILLRAMKKNSDTSSSSHFWRLVELQFEYFSKFFGIPPPHSWVQEEEFKRLKKQCFWPKRRWWSRK